MLDLELITTQSDTVQRKVIAIRRKPHLHSYGGGEYLFSTDDYWVVKMLNSLKPCGSDGERLLRPYEIAVNLNNPKGFAYLEFIEGQTIANFDPSSIGMDQAKRYAQSLGRAVVLFPIIGADRRPNDYIVTESGELRPLDLAMGLNYAGDIDLNSINSTKTWEALAKNIDYLSMLGNCWVENKPDILKSFKEGIFDAMWALSIHRTEMYSIVEEAFKSYPWAEANCKGIEKVCTWDAIYNKIGGIEFIARLGEGHLLEQIYKNHPEQAVSQLANF